LAEEITSLPDLTKLALGLSLDARERAAPLKNTARISHDGLSRRLQCHFECWRPAALMRRPLAPGRVQPPWRDLCGVGHPGFVAFPAAVAPTITVTVLDGCKGWP
jgi:hypothetical protein